MTNLTKTRAPINGAILTGLELFLTPFILSSSCRKRRADLHKMDKLLPQNDSLSRYGGKILGGLGLAAYGAIAFHQANLGESYSLALVPLFTNVLSTVYEGALPCIRDARSIYGHNLPEIESEDEKTVI